MSHKKKPRPEDSDDDGGPASTKRGANDVQEKDNDVYNFAPTVKIYDDHSDKQWSDLMLTNLLQCGQMAHERQRAGEKSDFATILYDEWKKIYPCSTLTTRNIK